MLKPVHRCTYICTHSTYSATIVCKHCDGIGLLSSPGHDDAWDLLQLPHAWDLLQLPLTSKVEKLVETV